MGTGKFKFPAKTSRYRLSVYPIYLGPTDRYLLCNHLDRLGLGAYAVLIQTVLVFGLIACRFLQILLRTTHFLEEIIKFLDNPVLFPAGATAEPDPILWQHCLEAGPMSLWYTKYLLWIHDVSGQFPDTLIQAILDHPTIRIFDRKVLHYAVYAGSDCYILELASNRPLPPPRLRPDHLFPF